MEALVAVGVPYRWARGGPVDLLPLVAALVALFILRFVIGARLTPVTGIVAATCGAAWAWAIAVWGIEMPTLAAVIATGVAAWAVDRPHPA